MRVVYLLRYNEYLGKITGVLDKIAYDLVIYFAFFLVEVLFFSLLAELTFRKVDTYNTTLMAFRNLFYATFGQFDFGGFQESQFTSYYGIAFLIVFLVVNIGLFMSLFVAMLVTLYGAFVEKQSVYHMLETLRIRPQTQADRDYSALVSIPPPLNASLLFLAPFLMTSKNPEAWNRAILWVAYLPVLAATGSVFFVYEVALVPLTFLKVMFHKMIMIFIYSKSYRVTKADKFMLWIFFIMVGPFRLTANVATDTAAFLKHSTMQSLKKTKVSLKERPLSKTTLRVVSQYLSERAERMVPFKQLAQENRELLRIKEQLAQFLLPQPTVNFLANGHATGPFTVESQLEQAGKRLNPIFLQIREYSTVKQILDGNAQMVVLNSSRVKAIDCKVMSVLFEDACRQKAISKVEDDNYIFIRRAVNVKSRAKL